MLDKPVSAQDKFMLRLPDGMREAIAERAKKNGRSMNSEIVQILGEEVYQVNQPDDEFDRMFEFVISEIPSDEVTRRIYDKIQAALVLEITKRIDRETSRLKTIFEIKNSDNHSEDV
ncbi:Arc family DNA-binding protein [Yersinia alsatica]|uniref:Arc family DNA-binding protein n=1 Tax=Yersinia alsatica TaxID=2890317 RepID=UPI0032EB80E9